MLEGTIDIAQLFGSAPDTILLAAASYGSANAGALKTAAQCPAGNGNTNIEAVEFVSVRLCDLTGGCCPADLDGTSTVDFGDVSLALLMMGDVGSPADLDGSGAVDFADVSVMLLDFGPCP